MTPCCHVAPHNYKKFNTEPLNLKDHSLKEIIEAGYIQKVLSEVNERDFCKRCLSLAKNNSYTIESLLLENLKMKRIMKEREQKKEQSNKR